MKKILAMLVAAALVMSLGVSQVFAADKASIAVKGIPSEGVQAGKAVVVTFSVTDLAKMIGTDFYQSDSPYEGVEFVLVYDKDKLVFGDNESLMSTVYTDAIKGEQKLAWPIELANGTFADGVFYTKVFSTTTSTKTNEKPVLLSKGTIDVFSLNMMVKEGVAVGEEIEVKITNVDTAGNERGPLILADTEKFGNDSNVICAKAQSSSFKVKVAAAPESTASTVSTASKGSTSSVASKDSTASVDPTASKKGDSGNNASTGDTGVLAVGALMILAAGATLVTLKKKSK